MKHGWILQGEISGWVNGDFYDDPSISNAVVFSTRRKARESEHKLLKDIVRKVELDKKGKAVKVIPGR